MLEREHRREYLNDVTSEDRRGGSVKKKIHAEKSERDGAGWKLAALNGFEGGAGVRIARDSSKNESDRDVINARRN